MTEYTIRTLPDPVLRQVAQPVACVDLRIAKFMDEMRTMMYSGRGIGLAANQIGVLERVITVDLSEEQDGSQALLMANPTIIKASDELFAYREGCLSVPENYAEVKRPKRILLGYIDQHNKPQELEAEDLLSICLQHEIDHLNGVLFIDHLSALKRNIIKKKLEKHFKSKDIE